MIGNFSVPNTRGAGRKIETWTHHFPDDEKAKIEVYLVSTHTRSEFQARSTHPLLKNFKWSHTDISRLADVVQSDIQQAISAHSGDRWQPALVLEVTPDYNDTPTRKVASVSISTYPVTLDVVTPPGNNGTRKVLREGVSGIVKERSVTDSSHLNTGTSRIRIESSTSRKVLLSTPKIERDIQNLQRTLEAFGRDLALTLSPDNPRPDSIPAPQDLVEMMQKAVDSAAL